MVFYEFHRILWIASGATNSIGLYGFHRTVSMSCDFTILKILWILSDCMDFMAFADFIGACGFHRIVCVLYDFNKKYVVLSMLSIVYVFDYALLMYSSRSYSMCAFCVIYVCLCILHAFMYSLCTLHVVVYVWFMCVSCMLYVYMKYFEYAYVS